MVQETSLIYKVHETIYNKIFAERVSFIPSKECDETLFVRLQTSIEVMKHIGPCLSTVEAKDTFNKCLKSSRDIKSGYMMWTIYENETSESIGFVAAVKTAELNNWELGIFLLPEEQGKGFGAESLTAIWKSFIGSCLSVGVYARTHIKNTKTQNLLLKIGFEIDHSEVQPDVVKFTPKTTPKEHESVVAA